MRKDFVKKVLSNGVVAYLYKDKNLKRMVASYNVKYGSLGFYDKFYYEDKLYEMPPAMAHFIEHSIFETSKYGNLLIKFKDLNYEVNGGTYPELTTFYFVGIKDTWESLKVLINSVDDPNFDRKNIEKVKRAVIEEANMTMDDKYRQAFNANKNNLFKNMSCVHETYNTLGTKETTESITYEDVRICYDAYYNSENKFLVIGGNFDIDEMVEYLESIYRELKPHPNKMREFDYKDYYAIRKPYEEMVKPVANDFALVSYKIRNEFKEPKILIDLYIYIFMRMKFGSDTKFISSLIEDKVIIGGIGYSTDFFKDVITVSMSCDVLNYDVFLKKLELELQNEEDLDEKNFELIKKSLKVNELSKIDYIYKSIMNFPTEVDFTDKLYVMDIIDSVSLEDMKMFIKKIKWNLKTVLLLKKEK